MRKNASLLVTGGAGFIGSALIRYLLGSIEFHGRILNYDLLTYAGNLENLKEFHAHPRYHFVQGDILDQNLIEKLLLQHEIDTIVHFAAESHVDRSIGSAFAFIETNVKGTFSLLEAVRKFPHIHFHHVSTDEVYGSLGKSGVFTENSNYQPNSPYSASKAASDHLVRAFARTYNLSTTISHCSNNYGPYQYPEKFIPLMIHNCLKKKPLPIYGQGANIRDWIYVEDHVEAIWQILQKAEKGKTYNIGGKTELSNLELLYFLIELIQKQKPDDYHSLIRFVKDRAGHDFRYALDTSKIEKELGFKPRTPLKKGLEQTVQHYFKKIFNSCIFFENTP